MLCQENSQCDAFKQLQKRMYLKYRSLKKLRNRRIKVGALSFVFVPGMEQDKADPGAFEARERKGEAQNYGYFASA